MTLAVAAIISQCIRMIPLLAFHPFNCLIEPASDFQGRGFAYQRAQKDSMVMSRIAGNRV